MSSRIKKLQKLNKPKFESNYLSAAHNINFPGTKHEKTLRFKIILLNLAENKLASYKTPRVTQLSSKEQWTRINR